ncbi:hypothetical protein PR202_ga30329 [Eleusine coracana subsp. coracana]|uniref:C2H2-type domain-containing protein n=1 Tax=Eleusine coracana subsp. coracana TaxID=191504 RepID=A0AAV5DN61_ELECO|nr:hypothetical protein PR202_ga30329 [Eleusine coracana subsp. coracana]
MERDHGRGIKQQQQASWTPGHNFSLAGRLSSSSYTCGYCRREFRSAQALGGHMNVHRRDRARLRQCCSSMMSYPPTNSSTLIAASSHRRAAAAAASPTLLPNLNFVPPPHTTTADPPVVYSFFSTTTTTTMTKAAAAVEVNLEMGIGGVCSSRGGVVAEEGGLDLELRLGCSWE